MKKIKGLYLVTDRDLCGGRPLDEIVLAAVRGGAACVQLREKDLPTRSFVEEARSIKALLAPFRVPLIINDRIDVALAVAAEGVHIGQDDMPYPLARRILGSGVIIGLSVETWADVEQAEEWDVDYLGVSPVFETPTKTDTRGSWGLEGIARIRAYSRHPLIAIGGLHAANTGAATRAGADGIAVVSAICAAPDPFRAAQELCVIIDESLKCPSL
jgi:thiamine-phosphate pyrophosphorylase